eukprot:479889-Rhodomonas_salina.2
MYAMALPCLRLRRPTWREDNSPMVRLRNTARLVRTGHAGARVHAEQHLFSTLSSSSFSPKASSHTPFPRGATARLPHTAKWVNCDHSAWPLANLDQVRPPFLSRAGERDLLCGDLDLGERAMKAGPALRVERCGLTNSGIKRLTEVDAPSGE